MDRILRPFANALNPRRILPRGTNLYIDQTHPLARGLVGAYVPAAMGGVNLVGLGGSYLSAGAFASWGMSSEGPGVKNNTTSGIAGFYGLNAPAFFRTLNNGASLYCRAHLISAPSNNTYLIGISDSNADTGPFVAYTIGTTGPSWSISWNSGGSIINATFNPVSSYGKLYSFGATFQRSPVLNAFYSNGVSIGTPDTTNAISASVGTATSTINVGCQYVEPARSCNAIALVGYFWNRPLSAQEQAMVDADPYGMIISGEYEMPVVFKPVPISTEDMWHQTISQPYLVRPDIVGY